MTKDERAAWFEKCRTCEKRIKIAHWRNLHWLGWSDCPLKCEGKPVEPVEVENG